MTCCLASGPFHELLPLPGLLFTKVKTALRSSPSLALEAGSLGASGQADPSAARPRHLGSLPITALLILCGLHTLLDGSAVWPGSVLSQQHVPPPPTQKIQVKREEMSAQWGAPHPFCLHFPQESFPFLKELISVLEGTFASSALELRE